MRKARAARVGALAHASVSRLLQPRELSSPLAEQDAASWAARGGLLIASGT